MCKFLFFLSFVVCISADAQYQPAINGSYNYTQMPFEWDAAVNTTNYIIKIKELHKEKIIFSTKTKYNSFLLNDVLEFGKKYEWQITSFETNKQPKTSDWMPFSINTNANVLSKNVAFKIATAKKNAFQNDILFIENLGIAINRKGKPIWFLQRDESIAMDEKSYRSMQMTNEGNITFLAIASAYETDLQGKITWEAPKNGVLNTEGMEEFHHHFTKTPFNSYMVTSYAYSKEKHLYNSNNEVIVRYNTLIEYDKNGNVIWTWNEKNHANPKTIFDGSTGDEVNWAGTHMNGFAFNPIDNSLFLSYRNSSQIQKIDYLTGKVLYTWSGKPTKFNKPEFTFYNQHGPSITADGNLIIYNNNIQNIDTSKALYPTIQIVQNPTNANKGNLLWEYECKWDAKKKGIQTKEGFALELKNKNILVTIGGTERIFEINKKKEIVWDCTFKKLDKDSINLIPFSNYRCYNTATLHPILFALNGTKQNKEANLSIQNLGNEDEYIITIMDVDNKFQIHNINKKASANQIINLNLHKEIPFLPNNYLIKVTSKTNKTKVKEILF